MFVTFKSDLWLQFYTDTQYNVNDYNIAISTNQRIYIYFIHLSKVSSICLRIDFSSSQLSFWWIKLLTNTTRYLKYQNKILRFHLMYEWMNFIILFLFIFQITNYARNYIHLLCFLFRIFILFHGFITIFLVRYFICCTANTKRKGGGKQRETSIYINRLCSSHSLLLFLPTYIHIFYAILLLHHNSYTLRQSIYILYVCACVFVFFLSSFLFPHHFHFFTTW